MNLQLHPAAEVMLLEKQQDQKEKENLSAHANAAASPKDDVALAFV